MMFLASTAATEAAFDFKSIKELMDGFDPAALLPEVDTIVGKVQLVCSLAILAAPVIMLLMGLAYLLFAPKEANYYFGYRTAFGMGSVSAWRHTQRVAGLVFGGLGLILTILMLMILLTFSGREAMDMVWLAVKCLLWEGALGLAAILSINSLAMYTYDYNGNRRRKTKKRKA
ncbi:MAG: SdpI family protein [Firmicutes bacterium]|nr:SdpI family protein [Bacillota bacterium]MDY6159617.1 SdpI family protein [Candidatus Faecousia sp.]